MITCPVCLSDLEEPMPASDLSFFMCRCRRLCVDDGDGTYSWSFRADPLEMDGVCTDGTGMWRIPADSDEFQPADESFLEELIRAAVVAWVMEA